MLNDRVLKTAKPKDKPYKIQDRDGMYAYVSTTGTISLIGATAMAGAVGAGGIGDLAISYGYQRFDTSVVILTVIVLLLLVQFVQSFGDWLAKLR